MHKALQKISLPKFLTDVLSLSGSRFVNLGLTFIIGVLIARLLGPEGKGIMTTALVIPGLVLSFADLGMRQAITFYMGKKIYDDQRIISTVSLLIFLTSILGTACALAGYLLTGFETRYGWAVILISLCVIPSSLALTYSSGVFMAKREISKISLIFIIPTILQLIGVTVLFILRYASVEWLLAINVVSVFITAILVLYYLRKYGSLRPVLIPELVWVMLKKGLVYAAALFVISLNYRVDIIILEYLTNSTQVGVYSVGVTVADMLWLLPGVINMVNFSHSASSTDSLDYARKTAFLLRIVLWGALAPFVFLFFLSPYVIPWIYGIGFATSGMVVQAILPGVWAMLIFKILNSDLAGRGRPEAAFWVYLLAAIINIVFNIWWDPLYGAVGAAWASTVSYTFGGLLFGVVYARMSSLSLADLFILRRNDIQPFFALFAKN